MKAINIELHKQQYECKGSGYALVRINGKNWSKILLSQYSLHYSYYWSNGKRVGFCAATIQFINGSITKNINIVYYGSVELGNGSLISIVVSNKTFNNIMIKRITTSINLIKNK